MEHGLEHFLAWPLQQVGSVIGKAGVIVKQIREETGARIRVVEGVPGCDERVIVISSRNDSRPSNSAQVRLSNLLMPAGLLLHLWEPALQRRQ